MRTPVHAGSFYPASPVELEKAIEQAFLHEKGPGVLPGKRSDKLLKGVLVPHAGIIYSGPCAAWSYKALGESKRPDTYIILAPNHYSLKSGIGMETFETPLGYVRVDQELARTIASKGNIEINNEIHLQEHAIEVQLPWLQFINKPSMEKVRILPILVSSDIDLKQVALDIKEAILDLNREVSIVISSDFTHYGRIYRYVPFSIDPLKQVYEQDGKALSYIENLDVEGFLNFIDETGATICGAYAIALGLMLISKARVKIEQYYTSAEITGDKKNFVAYASIIFEDESKE
ncbi:AmmeMemoRadiSam system protein B [Candidatus Woesearchaeota archaeon]|nr:AmmeMemoRadiSam system protein B [Candidatus Woesearchaeota archaeon]